MEGPPEQLPSQTRQSDRALTVDQHHLARLQRTGPMLNAEVHSLKVGDRQQRQHQPAAQPRQAQDLSNFRRTLSTLSASVWARSVRVPSLRVVEIRTAPIS